MRFHNKCREQALYSVPRVLVGKVVTIAIPHVDTVEALDGGKGRLFMCF